jgi:rhodanese-related sulfurtransferase
MFGFLKKEEYKTLNVNEINDLIGKIELIDIREPYEYLAGSLKTAKNIPMQKLLKEPSKYLRDDKSYYLMCYSGSRSGRTCRYLAKQGYDVVNITGGYVSYVGTKRK